jgi:cell division cycle protein 20 (cofactor of APC complex)
VLENGHLTIFHNVVYMRNYSTSSLLDSTGKLQTPDRILDAPEIVDDYYLNLLDWSSKNVVAVALGTMVYLWHAETGAIEQLLRTTIEDDYISSISWAEDGRTIAVGFYNHDVQLWDACRACKFCTLQYFTVVLAYS